METVKCLGGSLDVSEVLFIDIEEYSCVIYNAKNKTVNPARAELFTKKYANENRINDLSFLQPCKSTSLLHVKHSNYMAKLWKTCLDRDFTLPNSSIVIEGFGTFFF